MAKLFVGIFYVMLSFLAVKSMAMVIIETEGTLSSYTQRLADLGQESASLRQRIDQMERTTSTKVITQVRLSRTSNVDLNARVLYDLEVSNIGGAFDLEHGEFTAPVDGTYYVFLQACVSFTTYMDLAIMKDGAVIGKLLSGDVDYNSCSSHSLVTELATGDKMWVVRVGGNTAVLSELHAWNTFTAVLIS